MQFDHSDLGKKILNDPEGVKACSRWLSAATPPESWKLANAPERVPANWFCSLYAISRLSLAPLRGAMEHITSTGGVAALNHRLMAVTPSEYFLRGRRNTRQKKRHHNKCCGVEYFTNRLAANETAAGYPHGH